MPFPIVFKMMDKRGNSRGIHYHIMTRETFHVIRYGKESKAHWLFTDLKLGECKHLSGIYYVNGQPCYLSGSKIKDKEGKPELPVEIQAQPT